jgi:hypothetical protein
LRYAYGTTARFSTGLLPHVCTCILAALPNFKCPDKFDYDGKQTVISLACSVASSDLSSYYITWRNTTANMTVTGTRGVDIQAPGDSRYVLRVNAPQVKDVIRLIIHRDGMNLMSFLDQVASSCLYILFTVYIGMVCSINNVDNPKSAS